MAILEIRGIMQSHRYLDLHGFVNGHPAGIFVDGKKVTLNLGDNIELHLDCPDFAFRGKEPFTSPVAPVLEQTP